MIKQSITLWPTSRSSIRRFNGSTPGQEKNSAKETKTRAPKTIQLGINLIKTNARLAGFEPSTRIHLRCKNGIWTGLSISLPSWRIKKKLLHVILFLVPQEVDKRRIL